MKQDVASFSIARPGDSRQIATMLSSDKLLKRLREREIRNADIARLLELDPSTITQMMNGKRRILLDVGKRLTEAFSLEDEPETPAISRDVARLLVRHGALAFGIEPP